MQEIEVMEGRFSKFYNLLSLFRLDQVKDLDCIVGVTGRKGCGKSSLTIKAAIEFHKRFLKTRFKPKFQIVYTPEQLDHAIDTVQEYSVIVWDEAVMGAMGEDWNKSVSKILKKKITQCRTKHLVIFLNIPDITWLDGKYRNSLLSYWIHIVDRGLAVWFTPDTRPACKDCWHLDLIDKAFSGRSNIQDPKFNPEPMIKKLLRHPCCEESFVVPRLDQEVYERYLAIRNKAVFGDDENGFIRTADRVGLVIYLFRKYLEALYEEELPLPKPSNMEFERILTVPGAEKPLFSNQRISDMLKLHESGFRNN